MSSDMAGTKQKEAVKETSEPEKHGGIGHLIKPLAIASVVAGTAWLARRVSDMLDPYDGMDDIVSYSSRMIAGNRIELNAVCCLARGCGRREGTPPGVSD